MLIVKTRRQMCEDTALHGNLGPRLWREATCLRREGPKHSPPATLSLVESSTRAAAYIIDV